MDRERGGLDGPNPSGQNLSTSPSPLPLEPSPSLRDWITSSEASGQRYASHFLEKETAARERRSAAAAGPRAKSKVDSARALMSKATGSDKVSEASEEPDPYMIPKACEAVLEKHSKTLAALAVDKAGSRIITGANDGQVHLHDFGGMKKDMRSFRKFSPTDSNHQVKTLSWSPTGDCFLVVTTSAQAKVYDRDGRSKGEFARGDMYLHDVRQTKGHTAGLTSGHWHPVDRSACVTSSDDGTVRIWDVTNLEQKTVIKPNLGKPGRFSVSCCSYNASGSILAAGTMDGTIQLWAASGKLGQASKVGTLPAWKVKVQEKQRWMYTSRPGQLVRKAHDPESEITSLCFAENGSALYSRAGDHTLKVWDLRKLKTPVKVFANLPCNSASTGCILSPDQQLLVTGVSADETGREGGLFFYDTVTLDFARKLTFPKSVTCLQWHERLNQIFLGSGCEAKILFDPELSTKGALMCLKG